jgi:hypothetical protein
MQLEHSNQESGAELQQTVVEEHYVVQEPLPTCLVDDRLAMA